ncbi:hypothetical protein TNCV_1986711 [Trichonephila clavipes]|nr:hypothetical protein TNCV_1986711 [Trichonephila clavipes]
MNEITQQEKTTQLVSRNETTKLRTAVDRLRPPTTACNHLHRLYNRIGFFYLLPRLTIFKITNIINNMLTLRYFPMS